MLSVTNLTPNIENQVKCLKSQSKFEVYLLLYQILHLHFIIQGVHKVSLQFKKIIKKWNDEISQWGLFYVNQYFVKFLLTLKFIVSDKISY